MKPVDDAVLAVLMVLLTAAQSLSPLRKTEPTTIETTIETTTEPITTVCPTVTCDDPNCFVENGQDGCPRQCICGDPICTLYPCGPDEECVPNEENPSGYTCVSIYGTTTETTTETIIGPPTRPVCPDMSSSCDLDCGLDYGNMVDGCPTCLCVEPTCEFIMNCGPDEVCAWSHEYPSRSSCVSKYGTTTETTTETTTGTTIGTPSPPVCPDISWCGETGYCYPGDTLTSDGCPMCTCSCQFLDCPFSGCLSVLGPDGCETCDCSSRPCDWLEQCGPDEECLPSNDEPLGYTCVSIHGTTIIPPPGTTTETPTETPTQTTTQTTIVPTTTCPVVECGNCALITGSDGCPNCTCLPTCGGVYCAEDQDCRQQEYDCNGGRCLSEPTCVSRTTTETTTETTIETTITNCPMVSSCGLYCSRTTRADGCSDCDCSTPCEFVTCPPGEQCVPNSECHGIMDQETCYSCVSISDTTTTTPTATTYACLWPMCRGESCITYYGPEGCLRCDCQNDPCQYVACAPDEQCVPNDECPNGQCYSCVSIYGTTTETTTWPTKGTPTPTVCPDMSSCVGDCRLDFSSGECPTCICFHSICWYVTCPPGEQCVPNEECPGGVCHSCVSMHETTTSCPMFTCAPDCVPGTGPDGCPTCDCPPSCQTVKCSADHECQLVNVTCKRDPCFPQPQCVPIKNPCTGTPNPRRCGRSRNRWTYNSVTNTCEKFKYYGCAPSLNTFLSPKACKNKCKGGAQSICEDVVCETNCSTFTRKNKCPKCICPNPCKGFKCREGYECKLRESKCENKDPKPFCARK